MTEDTRRQIAAWEQLLAYFEEHVRRKRARIAEARRLDP